MSILPHTSSPKRTYCSSISSPQTHPFHPLYLLVPTPISASYSTPISVHTLAHLSPHFSPQTHTFLPSFITQTHPFHPPTHTFQPLFEHSNAPMFYATPGPYPTAISAPKMTHFRPVFQFYSQTLYNFLLPFSLTK